MTSYLQSPDMCLLRTSCDVIPGVAWHVLAEVGEQHGDVEADVLGGRVEAVGELGEVDFAVLVRVHAHHDVLDLFPETRRQQRPSVNNRQFLVT